MPYFPVYPTLSVVIPCFDAERYVLTAIGSVLAQHWPGIEIIVVDDGSTDHSAALVQDTFPQVHLVRQPNQGVAAARNTGIAQAQGEWIAFLDADDLWLDGKLDHQWQQLQANPGVRMNYTAWQVWPSEDPLPSETYLNDLRKKARNKQNWDGASGWIYPALLLDCVVWTSTVLAHHSVFEEVGNFDTNLRIGEDYELWLRISRVTPIHRVPQPLALYRSHSASITKSTPTKNHEGLVIKRALDRWALASPDGSSANKAQVYRALARTWSDFSGASLAAGQTVQAWQGATMSIKTYWRQRTGWKVLIRTLWQFLVNKRPKRSQNQKE